MLWRMMNKMFWRNKPLKIYFDGSEDCDNVERIVKYLSQYYGDHIEKIKVPKKYRK